MSEIRMAYPVREMLELVEQPTLIGVPHEALWWRLHLLRSPDGTTYVMQIDDMGSPTSVTVRWHDDGREEAIQPYAMQISTDHDGAPDLGRNTIRALPYTKTWLDVLSVDAPTSNPRWEQLTRPGDHRHPDAIEEIERRRAAKGLLPIWTDRLVGRR